MKILGIDLGKKRIGIALGDTEDKIAVGLPTMLQNRNIFDELKIIVDQNNIKKIIIGLPKTLSGKLGEQGVYTQKWVKDLSLHLDIATEFEDERLSSKMARDGLVSIGKKLSKENIDQAAAVLILQSYIDRFR